MPKTKVTPRAKHPNKTKQFLDATQIALEMFDDEISSFTDEVKEKAYKHYIRSYREHRKIGANQQDSAQFAHLLRKLREFRAFRSKLIHV